MCVEREYESEWEEECVREEESMRERRRMHMSNFLVPERGVIYSLTRSPVVASNPNIATRSTNPVMSSEVMVKCAILRPARLIV